MHRARYDGQAGESGLQLLFGELRPELRRFMLLRGCDPDEVEDALQDLYVKLDRTETGPVANPRGYLYEMANNLLHDLRRSHRRRRAREDLWVRSRGDGDLQRASDPSPEQSAISRDALAHVNAALAAMPARTAEIIRLYRLEGLSQKAIAIRLGISLSAVEKHLQRAYRRLHDLREQIEGGASEIEDREDSREEPS